jgi:hypothetical protein
MKQPISFLYSLKLEQHLIFRTEKGVFFSFVHNTEVVQRHYDDNICIFLMIFATDIPHFKCTFHKQFIHLHTFDYYLRSEIFFEKITLEGTGL